MRLLQVGEDFPGPVPDTGSNSGGLFEIDPDGTMQLFGQFPDTTRAEFSAIFQGFSGYSIYCAPTPPHVAVLVWKYPAPVGYMETPFHAGAYQDGRMADFQRQSSQENNALTVISLNRQRIIGLKMCGLLYSFVDRLHEAIALQLQYPVSQEQYRAALESVYRFTSRELYERGAQFRHR